MNEDARRKRSWKHYLLDRELQVGYLSIYFVTFVVFIVGFIVMNVIFLLLLRSGLGEQAPKLAEDFTPFLLYNSGLIIFIAVVLAAYSIVHSHRVAGPIYNIRRCLRRLRADDYSVIVQLRDKDFFHDMANEVNDLSFRLLSRDEVIADAIRILTGVSGRLEGDVAEQVGEVTRDLLDILHDEIRTRYGVGELLEAPPGDAEEAPVEPAAKEEPVDAPSEPVSAAGADGESDKGD